MVRVAALVVQALEERGLFTIVIVVGGSAVPMYTEGSEATEIIDLVVLESGLRVHPIGLGDLILDRVDQAAAQGSPTGDARRQALLLMVTHWEDLHQHYIREQPPG